MPAVVLSLISAALMGALIWLVLGNRFRFSADGTANDWKNLGAYAVLALPFALLIVMLLLPGVL